MAIFTVGPNSTFPSIAAAMLAAGPGDVIQLESGYSNETATVTHEGITITGDATSTGIVIQIGAGVATFTLAGEAPINVLDALDGEGVVGNAGANVITVTDGSDAVDGGAGVDRLVVDYRASIGAVSGDSTSNFTEAGGSRMVTITDGTIEHFTVLTGAGADTITTGAGDDYIDTGEGAGTVTAGQGANVIVGGSGADTFTALDGGNIIHGGDGANVLTSGDGADIFTSGVDADTIVAGGGDDHITVLGGADTVAGGAGNDTLVIDYSALVTDVTGGVTGGDLGTGYTGALADQTVHSVSFNATENFIVTTGSGNDGVTTGDGIDSLSGGAGNDVLASGGGADTLAGGDGADTLAGGAGGDALNGGDGSDFSDYGLSTAGVTINLALGTASGGDAEGDVLTGIENLTGSYSSDSLTGDSAANGLFGGLGDDVVDGGLGDDVLIGGGGADSLTGGDGNDTIEFGSEDTLVSGGIGFDTGVVTSGTRTVINLETASLEYVIDAAGGDDWFQGTFRTEAVTVFAGAGTDVVQGGAGNDVLWGEAGADILVGGAGTDVLNGGAGADLMNGGLGRDELYGGAADGAQDLFRFTTSGAANWDYVAQFEVGTDKIDLRALSSSFGDVTINVVGANSEVFVSGQQVATVMGVTTLTAADFLFGAGPAPADPGDGVLFKGADDGIVGDPALVRPTLEDDAWAGEYEAAAQYRDHWGHNGGANGAPQEWIV